MLKKDHYRVLGMMSGTSCDGLDIAHCRFHFDDEKWKFEIVHADSYPYPERMQSKLKNVTSLSALELAHFDVELGYFFAHQAEIFLHQFEINKHTLDFISSHGHTVFHQPSGKLTLQIGNGEALLQKTGIPVINNFRVADVLAGGQGAPLVPVGDHLLFSENDFCLNLGGISNVSFVHNGNRVAFDTGPHNLAINLIANRAGLAMDRNGDMARKGQLIPDLKKKLDSFNYYELTFPKSLGIEDLQHDFFPFLLNEKNSNEDILNTLYHHLAGQISKAIIKFSPANAKLLITGGGAHNRFFVQLLQEYLKDKITVVIPGVEIIDFKEALVFAFLGVLRVRNEVNVYKSVTGAENDSCAGVLFGF